MYIKSYGVTFCLCHFYADGKASSSILMAAKREEISILLEELKRTGGEGKALASDITALECAIYIQSSTHAHNIASLASHAHIYIFILPFYDNF
jgi:hypothetical protein